MQSFLTNSDLKTRPKNGVICLKHTHFLLTFFFLALLSSTNFAKADEWLPDSIGMSLASYHVDIDPTRYDRTEWNEFNPGLFLSWEDRFLGLNYSAGGFVNSYDKFATYIGASYFWAIAKDVELGPFIGIADYGENSRFFDTHIGNSDYIVIGGVQLNYKNAFIQYLPVAGSEGGLGGVFAVGLSFRFNNFGK